MSASTADRIVAEALRWCDTPYHHCADVRGVGVDCAMLLVRVFVDAGLVEPFDPRPYPPDWMLHRDEERFLGWVSRVADPVETPQPGDVVIYRFGRCFAHGGVLDTPTTMIHADRDAGRVERCDLSRWASRRHQFWRVRTDG